MGNPFSVNLTYLYVSKFLWGAWPEILQLWPQKSDGGISGDDGDLSPPLFDEHKVINLFPYLLINPS